MSASVKNLTDESLRVAKQMSHHVVGGRQKSWWLCRSQEHS